MGLDTRMRWPVPARATSTYPGRPTDAAPLPRLGNEEAHRALGPSDMGRPGPITRRHPAKPRNSKAGQGGSTKGGIRALGRTGRWRRASHCCRDISTISSPHQLMPHPPPPTALFSTLIKTTLFPPLRFIASGPLSASCRGSHPVKFAPALPRSRTATRAFLWITLLPLTPNHRPATHLRQLDSFTRDRLC